MAPSSILPVCRSNSRLNTFVFSRLSEAFRKLRLHNTIVGLLSLFIVIIYIFFFFQPSLAAPTNPRFSGAHSWRRHATGEYRQHLMVFQSSPSCPQITLSPSQELASLTSFIAAHPQNVIPPDVDLSLPIDPELILGFNTRGPHAQEELEELVRDVWRRNPVVLFCKKRSSVTRELRAMLAQMKLYPAPTIVEVDERDDAEVVIPLLHRLTSSTDIPILLVGGQPLGDIHTIRELSHFGQLQEMVTNAGAEIDGGKKNKKSHRPYGKRPHS
ncbi:hypothetical protein OF83DRAFT_1172309 [Amylostereum chailletii]|nr:hypothetical protein OF83DRAFT_1172309 [Amylostereum chailletii]